MHTRAVWWSKLAALGVSFDRRSFELNPAKYAETLVPAVMRTTNCNVEYVTRFATDHGIGTDALVALIVPLLLEMSPRTTGIYGREEIDAEYQLQIERALAHVSDKTKVLATLDTKHRQLVGAYDYTRLRFLFKLILALEADVNDAAHTTGAETSTRAWASDGLLLLGVLWHYTRRAAPTDAEIEAAHVLQHGGSSAKDAAPAPADDVCAETKRLSAERLPFHVLAYGDALSVITPELCLETANSLAPLAKLLPGEFKPDDFLVTLLQRLLQTEGNLPTLEHLKPIYEKIADDETALMAAKDVAEAYPVGEDKIAALQLGIDRAGVWSKSLQTPSKEQQSVDRIRARMVALSNTVKTEHLLNTHGMSTEESGKLLDKPEKLVEHLYETHLVECSASLSQLAALHATVDDVGSRHGFDCDGVRKRLLQGWLSAPRTMAGGNSSAASAAADAPLSLAGILDEDDDDKTFVGVQLRTHAFPIDANLTRAAIMLRHSPTDDAIQRLVHFAYVCHS
jgi:hypothetical protein